MSLGYYHSFIQAIPIRMITTTATLIVIDKKLKYIT